MNSALRSISKPYLLKFNLHFAASIFSIMEMYTCVIFRVIFTSTVDGVNSTWKSYGEACVERARITATHHAATNGTATLSSGSAEEKHEVGHDLGFLVSLTFPWSEASHGR